LGQIHKCKRVKGILLSGDNLEIATNAFKRLMGPKVLNAIKHEGLKLQESLKILKEIREN
jgi:hypothetical protein